MFYPFLILFFNFVLPHHFIFLDFLFKFDPHFFLFLFSYYFLGFFLFLTLKILFHLISLSNNSFHSFYFLGVGYVMVTFGNVTMVPFQIAL